MDHSLPPYGIILLFIVLAAWLYFRYLRVRRKRGQKHGRDLWRESVRERRLERLDGARSWEERRQRRARIEPERQINPRFLRGRSAAGEEPGESDAEGAGAAAPGRPGREERR